MCYNKVCGIRKMALPQFSKLKSGVRFSYPAPEYRSIAQPDSALALGARGRRFDSCYSDQFILWRSVWQVKQEKAVDLVPIV
jgi:hypothetical protein